jgi:TctA family transporter
MGDPMIFLQKPLSATLLALSAFLVIAPVWRRIATPGRLAKTAADLGYPDGARKQ